MSVQQPAQRDVQQDDGDRPGGPAQADRHQRAPPHLAGRHRLVGAAAVGGDPQRQGIPGADGRPGGHLAFHRVAAEDWQRALQVQAALADAGRWRAVGLADLVTAAVAERHRVTVLHYDGDFDSVAAVTGQATEWVVPAGSVP